MVHKPALIVDDQEVVELIRQRSPGSATSTNEVEFQFQTETYLSVMPPAPAPFEQVPASPSLGEEAGMEALWVEELVSPSLGEDDELPETQVVAEKKPSRRSGSFFPKRLSGGGLLWKRQAVKEEELQEVTTAPRSRKVLTSVKLLDEETQQDLQLPLKQKTNEVISPIQEEQVHNKREEPSTSTPMDQRQSSFGANDGEEEERDTEILKTEESVLKEPAPESKPEPPLLPPHSTFHTSNALPNETMSQISAKANTARKLLAKAMDKDTAVTECEGLAKAAFAEAMTARLMLEGANAPKGLDLVLRAASHKGRSAALAAAFSPDNGDQQSRAQHYMDLILPPKTIPIMAKVTPPPPPPPTCDTPADDGEVSTLGFDITFSQDSPVHRTIATGESAGQKRSPMSMSSLNEILDGPEDENNEEKKQDGPSNDTRILHRLPFLHKKKSTPQKENDHQDDEQTMNREVSPPVNAPKDDDAASWTNASLEASGADILHSKSSSSSNPEKKKRIFRLARFAGLAGAGVAVAGTASTSASSSKSGERRRWLRRGKSKDNGEAGKEDPPIVDHVPRLPPNVPYQSKPYQRYKTNVEVDVQSEKGDQSNEISTAVKEANFISMDTHERLQMALWADETEAVTSFDGVKMFGHNMRDDEEEEEEEDDAPLDPPEAVLAIRAELEHLEKRKRKSLPNFVPAPAGKASILAQKSWDILENEHAVSPLDRPKFVTRALLDEDNDDDNVGTTSHQGGRFIPPRDPPSERHVQHAGVPMMHPMSPESCESVSPGISDRYQSAEEPQLPDKYSTEEQVDENLCVIAGADSFETLAPEDSPLMAVKEEIDPSSQVDESQSQTLDTQRRTGRLSLFSRLQSRRKSNETPAGDAIAEDGAQLALRAVDNQTLRSQGETPKPRRKIKLFPKFQLKKKQESEEPVEYTQDENLTLVEAKENPSDSLGGLVLQETTTMTEGDNSHAEEVEIEDEEEQDNPVVHGHTTERARSFVKDLDPLIQNIRQQSSRAKRGIDPVTKDTLEVARGIDP